MKAIVILSIAVAVSAFTEDFSGDWESRWVQSKHNTDYGKFDVSAGKFFADEEKNKGLRTTQDAKFYAASTKFDKSVDGTAEDGKLVLQVSVKHEQGIDCGGGYVKLMKSDIDQADFHGETPYNIMFGPDHCGPAKKMIHIIFNHNGKNLLWKKEERAPDDKLTHLYTLVVDSKEQEYELSVDGEKKQSGKLEEDWDFLEPKEIDDSEDKKPADWVEESEIDDPEDKKPEDHDSIPKQISDPEATKPEDWDEEEDGAWEAPQVANPEYKGEWRAKRIPNPAYKGIWKPSRIANPKYVEDKDLAAYTDNGAIGVDIWQVRSGSIFDNFYVGNSVEEAKELAKTNFHDLVEAEKKAKDDQEEEGRKAAAAEAPATEKAAEPVADADSADEEEDEL